MATSFWDWSNLLGGDLSKLLGLGSPLNMPPPVPTGTSPTGVVTPPGPTLGGAPPAAASTGGLLGGPPLGHKGLFGDFGDSVLGHGLAGALAGIGRVQPGVGMLGALGQGAQGAIDAGDARQQQQLKNWYMQQTVGQAGQKTADETARKQQLETLIASLPPDQQKLARADPETFMAQYTKAQFAGTDPPKTAGGMQYNPQTKVWEPIPGYTDQARAIAEAGRSPRGPTTINMPGAPKPPATMEERDRDILLHGDPSSPEYAAAWDNFKRPIIHQNPDGTWSQVTPPDPTWARPPTYGGPGAAGGGGAPVAGDGTTPPPVTSSEVSGGSPASTTAAPPPAAGGAPATSPKGPTVTTTGTPTQKPPAPLTQDQQKTRQLYQHSAQQLPDILKNYDELGRTPNMLSAKIGGTLGNATMSGPAQIAYNGLLDFASSYLYVTSGATANPGEVQNLAQTLMPQIGDDASTLAAKKARMQDMLVRMGERAGSIPDTGQAPAVGGQGSGQVLHFDAQGNQITGP